MRRGNPDRSWTANFKAVSAATFVPLIAPFMTFSSLPLYVVALGGKAYEVGLVASTTNAAALVVRPLTGRLSAASAAPLLIGAVRARELRCPAGQ